MGWLSVAWTWAIGLVFKVSSNKTILEALKRLAGTDDGTVRLAEINAQVDIALGKEQTEQYLGRLEALASRQHQKMNQPLFWIIILVMMGPPALILWAVAVYNILWWQHGIFPQSWAIADFPPSIKPWVQASIDWLYDPVGAPGTVAVAAIASKLTGGRR